MYQTSCPEETAALAQKIGASLQVHDVVLLRGELGAGKTFFARALIRALCGEETDVPSPTFTLVQTYATPHFTLWHFDLYRLRHYHEIYELGLEEAYRTGISLIEWPERLGDKIPPQSLEITLTYGKHETARLITFKDWKEQLAV